MKTNEQFLFTPILMLLRDNAKYSRLIPPQTTTHIFNLTFEFMNLIIRYYRSFLCVEYAIRKKFKKV